jgi:hypothetical protein
VEATLSVRLEQSAAALIVAREVEIGRGSAALLILAREVHGDVKPLVDWRGALALGAGLAAVMSVLGGLRQGRR